MRLTLTATEWITIAVLFDPAPAPLEARTRRLQDRLYDMLCELRKQAQKGEPTAEIEHELSPGYMRFMRGYLADRPARQYNQAGWTQFIKPMLVDKLGWQEPVFDDEE